VNLAVSYLGLPLDHPFVAGASPLGGSLDGVKRLEDGGAAAIVLPSLFEEQITLAQHGRVHHMDVEGGEFAAALRDFPPGEAYALGPDAYLAHIRRAKSAVRVPVIASLNGTSAEAWLRFALEIEAAGADALEINIYDVAADRRRSGSAVETDLETIVRQLTRTLHLPVAMKLSPYYTALGHLAHRLDAAGAAGLVLFNRFYEPDIDADTMTIAPRVELSSSAELRLRLMWVAMLRGGLSASLAISGGVATAADGVKALLAGADAVQVVSALLRHGPSYFRTLRDGLTQWMDAKRVGTLADLRGRLSVAAGVDLDAWQRAHYIRTLQSWTAKS
jgi:dihydroorotate dehydrogenase (fumarate)